MLVQTAMYKWNNMTLDERILIRMKNLLACSSPHRCISPWCST
jgi:hypothetical protein